MNRSREALQARVDEMIEQCRSAGMNVTPQRIAIYRALLQSEEHPTPEMLFRVVSRKMPSLSLATIYKTLDAFVEIGLIRAVPVVSEKRRYDANVDPHHHLVCSSCGEIRDYYTHDYDSLVPSHPVNGFTPKAVSVNITGICAACLREKRAG
jgi:Fur family transcriptional regulator, peroxide stress response regulator